MKERKIIIEDIFTKKDKEYTTDVVVEEHDFAESKAASSQAVNYGSAPAAPAPAASSQGMPDGFMTIPEGVEEELPFI